MQGQVYFNTPPLTIVEHPADADHFYVGRRVPIQYICLHDTVGTYSLEWLSRTPGSNASSHRLISKGGVNYKLVQDQDTAWTNGPSILYTEVGKQHYQNDAYLTIEMEHLHTSDPSWPDVQVQMAAFQCVEWWGFYGFLPIFGHWQVQGNKQDPRGFPWSRFYGFMRDRLKECLR